MSDEEQEIVVKVDEQAEEKITEKPEEKVADTAVADLAKQYQELEAREAERAEREAAANRRAAEAERSAQEAIREAEAAKAQAHTSNLDTINTALASANAEVEAAKRDIRIAIEAGDAEAQAAAYDRLAGAKALALRYDEAKSDLEAKPEKVQRKEPERRPVDPVEAYIHGRSEPTQNWLRSHPDYITDQRKNAKLNAAHHDAVAEGYAPDSDKYFEHVENFLGMKDEPKGVKRPAARTVAPTTAATGSSPNGGNEVRLTPGEARAATDGTIIWNWDDTSPQKRFKKGDPIGVQEMARRKLAMQKQGAYDRSYEVQ